MLLVCSVAAQGAGSAMDFNANASGNNHVEIGQPAIGTSNFTVEFWVYVSNVSGDPALFSNKDWASGANTGINIAIQGGGSNLDLNFKGASGGREDLNITTVNFVGSWHHVAVTYDRSGNMTIFIDGVQEGSQDISGSTGSILGALPFNIGEDGTGDYTYTGTHYDFEGIIDEFRLWDDLRTQQEIRDNMCQKLSGTEPNLQVYYQFEDATGTSVTDLTGNFNGTINNAASMDANWTLSGAPVGDAASNNYPGAWTGQSVSLASAANGDLMIDNVNGTPEGIHVYRVDNTPSSIGGINQLGTNDVYYGMFVIGGSSPNYLLTYDYGGYSDAVTDEASIALYSRADNSVTTWSNYAASVNTGADNITKVASDQRGEVIIGDFASAPCNDPSALTASNVGAYSADLSWTTGGSGNWNIEYGPQGYTQGSGTQLSVTNNPYGLSGLTPGTAYDVYLQDDCGGTQSNWVGPVTFTTTALPSNTFLGSGTALDFDGNDDYVDLTNNGGNKASAASLNLPSQDLTIEAWVHPRNFQTWRSIVGFLQDNGSTESGWDLELRDGGKFGFTLASTGNGSLTYMESSNTFSTDQWYHVAGTYDGTTMSLYVNGVLEGTSTVQSGAIDYLDSWLVIGKYMDDNEDYTMDGQVDEVRIWNVARSEAEIRDMMCEKLSGSETGLVAYYRLDENGGTAVGDMGPNTMDGTLMNMDPADWVVSTAPIGDDSEHDYAGNWSGVSISLNSTDNGDLTVKNVSNAPEGVHIFRVDGMVDQMAGVNYPTITDVYYGVFVAEDPTAPSIATYSTDWDYGNFMDAVLNENDLIVLNRADKSATTWAATPSALNAGADIMEVDTLASRKEFILAFGTGQTCMMPSDLDLVSAGIDSAIVTWTTGGSTDWNLQWGDAGFSIGGGTLVQNTGSTTYEINGLVAQQYYEVYVQDTCLGTDASLWYGPLLFSTGICDVPSNLNAINVTFNSADLTWDGGAATSWDMVWGNVGFPVQFGIPVNGLTSPSHTLNGLASNTSYEYYVRSNCGGTTSAWIGPFEFTTGTDNTGINEIQGLEMEVLPNPANDVVLLRILSGSGQSADVRMLDLTGKVVQQAQFNLITGNVQQFDISSLGAGVYVIQVFSEGETSTRRLVKQ